MPLGDYHVIREIKCGLSLNLNFILFTYRLDFKKLLNNKQKTKLTVLVISF